MTWMLPSDGLGYASDDEMNQLQWSCPQILHPTTKTVSLHHSLIDTRQAAAGRFSPSLAMKSHSAILQFLMRQLTIVFHLQISTLVNINSHSAAPLSYSHLYIF